MPRAFHELGLVVTIALAFVPSTLAALRASRESDRARTGGVVVRKILDHLGPGSELHPSLRHERR